MDPNVERVLTTTRSVRLRLDLERAVPDEIIGRCIDIAEQAPTGGSVASRRWLVIRDRAVKRGVAEIYRAAGGTAIVESAARLAGTGHPTEQMLASAAHLANHLEDVPVLVLATIWGEHDGSGNPGLFDSVLQAAWSFCLALRAEGLGSAWTTMHLSRRDEMAALLGIPDGVTQVVLLPVAWTIGDDFHPAPRRPAAAITYVDHWGRTADGGTTVETDIDAPRRTVAAAVAAADLPAAWEVEHHALGPSRTRLRVHAADRTADVDAAVARIRDHCADGPAPGVVATEGP